MATTTAELVDSYLTAYGESDAARRRDLITSAFAENASLADPPFDAQGHDGIDEIFAAVQAQFPGNTFRRTSGVDEHHGAARYDWELVAADGSVTVAGTDYVRLTEDRRIAAVVGFFGQPPAIES